MIKEAIQKPEVTFWLSIIIPLLAVAITWGATFNRVNHLEKMVLGLQSTYSAQREQNTKIQVQLAEIQKDVLYIKAEIARKY